MLQRFLFGRTSPDGNDSGGTMLVSLDNHASEQQHVEDLLDGEGSGNASSVPSQGLGGSQTKEELEMRRLLWMKEAAEMRRPGDPELVPGERIVMTSHNISVDSATVTAMGSLCITSYRLVFHPTGPAASQYVSSQSAPLSPTPSSQLVSSNSIKGVLSPRRSPTPSSSNVSDTPTAATSTAPFVKQQAVDDIVVPVALISTVVRISEVNSSTNYSIDIVLKDMRWLRLFGFGSERTFTNLTAVAFPEGSSTGANTFFAFEYLHADPITQETDGWSVYQATKEYARMGLPNSNWRITTINDRYEFCPSYPRHLVVPASAADDFLFDAAKFRSQSRLPILCWINGTTKGGAIFRSAQPTSGITRRSRDDENLVDLLWTTTNKDNSITNIIIDARPRVNAEANRASGGGYEAIANYARTDLEFLGIENIHVVRDSFKKLMLACSPQSSNIADEDAFLADVEASDWNKHLRSLIGGTVRVVNDVLAGRGVLVHCSDGWDRTPQITSLAMVCLDPFYRTKQGLAVLIEKEWLSFGHKFHDRMGHGKQNPTDVERSPIFLQFLDALWQILRLSPNVFEYTEQFLIALLDESYACRYGTFLYNSERERVNHNIARDTVSVWTEVLKPRVDFTNANYTPLDDTILPTTAARNSELWRTLHLRYLPRRTTK